MREGRTAKAEREPQGNEESGGSHGCFQPPRAVAALSAAGFRVRSRSLSVTGLKGARIGRPVPGPLPATIRSILGFKCLIRLAGVVGLEPASPGFGVVSIPAFGVSFCPAVFHVLSFALGFVHRFALSRTGSISRVSAGLFGASDDDGDSTKVAQCIE
ncbi:hypothetical protein [Bradyrhizobium sp.]|uniref:hypothetical protein n=1 Tax=Bradyrhizobium sp. TaxID=376 RepID=UPI003C3BD62F